MDGYSETYKTSKGQYRYNYATRQLERLGNKIRMITISQRLTPVVELGVTDCINLKQSSFEVCPQYWVELYESVLERLVRK